MKNSDHSEETNESPLVDSHHDPSTHRIVEQMNAKRRNIMLESVNKLLSKEPDWRQTAS